MQKFNMAKKRTKTSGKRGSYKTEPEDLAKYGTLGIKLRQWRFFRNRMTIEDLADAAGLSTGTISGIEAGTSGFSTDSLGRLAIALTTTVAALFGLDPLKDEEFWSLWDRADAHQRDRIRSHAIGVVGKD